MSGVVRMKKKLSKEEISDFIRETRKQLSDFEHKIKNAPRDKKTEYKIWSRKTRSKLRQLEITLLEGTWYVE